MDLDPYAVFKYYVIPLHRAVEDPSDWSKRTAFGLTKKQALRRLIKKVDTDA